MPKAPITIGIIVTCMFHSFFQFSCKVEVLISLFTFFQFYSVVSRDSKVDNFADFLLLFFFFLLLIVAYRSSKVSDCIFEIHQRWQSGFSKVYSNCCCSCWFEPGVIKIGQSSHKMDSNKIVNFQEFKTILNAYTKKPGNLSYAPRIYIIVYLCIYTFIYYFVNMQPSFVHLTWMICEMGGKWLCLV